MLGQTLRINDLEDWLVENESSKSEVILGNLMPLLRQAEKQDNSKNQILVLKALVKIYSYRLKDVESALTCARKIKQIALKKKKSIYMIDYYNKMAEIYFFERLGIEKFYQYTDSAIIYGKKHFPNHPIPLSYSNSALKYLNEKDYPKALNIFYSLGNWSAINKSELYQKIYSNIGIAHMLAQNYDSVEIYFKKSLDLSFQTETKNDDFIRFLNLGIFYQETNQIPQAMEYLKKAENLINCSVLFFYKKKLPQTYAELYESLKQFQKANEYRKLEMLYNDSIQSFNLSEQISSFEHKERVKKLENSNQILELEKIALNRKSIIYVFMLITIIIGGLFIYVHFRNEKIKAQLQTEKEQLERINIAYEKDYAERETASKSMMLLEKENLIISILTRLKNEKDKFSEGDKPLLNEIISDLDRSLNNKRWIDFEMRFNRVHPEFLENLKVDFPRLTQNEKNLCCFLLLNMSSKDICAITYQSLESVKMARIRLRKKLNLTNTKQDLSAFLANYTNTRR